MATALSSGRSLMAARPWLSMRRRPVRVVPKGPWKMSSSACLTTSTLAGMGILTWCTTCLATAEAARRRDMQEAEQGPRRPQGERGLWRWRWRCPLLHCEGAAPLRVRGVSPSD